MPLTIVFRALFCIAVVGVAALFSASVAGDYSRNVLLDQYFRDRTDHNYNSKIVVVRLDEASLENKKIQWPWPRSTHAKLIDKLTSFGVKRIGFDILFAEYSDEMEDLEFAGSVESAGNVVLVSNINRQVANQTTFVDPAPIRDFFPDVEVGYDNMLVDVDGKIRTTILTQRAVGQDWLSFAAAVAGVDKLIQDVFYINYRSEPVKSYSYVDVLDYNEETGEIYFDKEDFRDAWVLIGFKLTSQHLSKSLTTDYYQTPLGLMAGVEIHANILDNILNEKLIKISKFHYLQEVAVLFGLLFSVLAFTSRPVLLFVLGVVLAFGCLWYSSHLLTNQLTFISPVPFLSQIIFILFAVPTVQYFISLRQRNFIKQAFSTYLSPVVVSELLKDPEALQLGGEVKDGSVVFIDIAGFTSLSEKVSPTELVRIMNIALGEFSDIIMKHGGMVDKFIGDCVMAVWGIPVEDGSHAENALAALKEISQATRRISEQHFEPIDLSLGVRMGVSSGKVIAGNVGGERRFNYTVLGNDVNLSARLESANKLYGTEILLSGSTAELLSSDTALRLLDLITVKGQTKAVAVYTIKTEEVSEELLEDYKQGFELYKKGSFKEAQVFFNKHPKDIPSCVLASRCEELEGVSNWNGVYNLQEK